MSDAFDDIAGELNECDRQERIELLIDYARSLPALPERYGSLKDSEHKVHECQSPVYLFVEVDPDQHVHLFADVPLEAPTVRGFVAILVTALDGKPVSEVLAVKQDVINRLGLLELLGMQRLNGLVGVLNYLKNRVARAAAGASGS